MPVMQPTDFIQTLTDMRNGEVLLDVNGKFNELLEHVLSIGAKGSITLTVQVQPSKRALGGAVVEVTASHDCKLKLPELAIGNSLFFVTKDGRLTRDDPAQTEMFETQEVK